MEQGSKHSHHRIGNSCVDVADQQRRNLMSKDYWIKWIKAAGVRAIKTVAQTAVALIGTNAIGITEVDWIGVASGAALAGVVSLLTSLAGIPEVEAE